MLIWKGIVAVDLLLKLRHTYRPYEQVPGDTDALYERCLADVISALQGGQNKPLLAAMERAGGRFGRLPVQNLGSRPKIGLVGEIYLRLNDFSNQDIVRKVEAAGGEVFMASMIEWLYFINWGAQSITKLFQRYLPYLLTRLTDSYQRRWENKLAKPVAHLLAMPLETPIEELMALLRPYYEPYLGTEAVLTMGKAIELAHLGFAGILNVMPFTCMPGLIAAGMAPKFRPDNHNIPWLDISYEAQRSTNLTTRLGAFMFQAHQFNTSMTRNAAGPAGASG